MTGANDNQRTVLVTGASRGIGRAITLAFAECGDDDLAKDGKLGYFEKRIPAGRVGEPQDIAGVVRFLASPDAAYINGAEVLIDGGMLVNLQ